MIVGVEIIDLQANVDSRGGLIELWRMDDDGGACGASRCPLDEWGGKVDFNQGYSGPVMSYISWTKPGAVRGIHLHKNQVDNFYFTGPGVFKVMLIDARPGASTSGQTMEIYAGGQRPRKIVVPDGVLHGYKNVSTVMGLVINFPNSLFKGWDRKHDVDEIRYEPHSMAATYGLSWQDKDN